MSDSFAAIAARFLVPVMKPTGRGYWQIIVALISGVAAKEVVVSSMSVLFGVANAASAEGMAALSGVLGGMGFTWANAYAMMIFVLLYVPCVATIGAIRRESGSWKLPLGTGCMQPCTAWVGSAVVYNLLRLI